MTRDIGYERDRVEVYSQQSPEVQASLDTAQDPIVADQLAVNAIVTHVKNGGQPLLTTAVEERARERNLMGAVYERIGIGGPEQALLMQVTRRIIDPEGKWARAQAPTPNQASAPRPIRYYRA